MDKQDYKRFAEQWFIAHEIMAGGKVFSNQAMGKIFEILNQYQLDSVLGAIDWHLNNGKFAPTPNDIKEIITEHSGTKHVGAEEAWSIALQSFDEINTVVITKQILEAKAIVQDIYDSGDVIGARMAFKEAYNRIIKIAGDVKWFVSQGDDKSQAQYVVAQAINMGRLLPGTDEKYRIEPALITTQKLIERAQEKGNKIDNKFMLRLVKNELTSGKSDFEIGLIEREMERQKFEKHREEIINKAKVEL